MTQAELDAWADKAFASFERDEEKRRKEERAQRWAAGNGYRKARLANRATARAAINERLSHKT